jgi:branched-chain amino acid transport system substrate-binding protein
MNIPHTFRRAVLAAAITLVMPVAMAQAPAKLKVGFMLPATGTFAALGTAIENLTQLNT